MKSKTIFALIVGCMITGCEKKPISQNSEYKKTPDFVNIKIVNGWGLTRDIALAADGTCLILDYESENFNPVEAKISGRSFKETAALLETFGAWDISQEKIESELKIARRSKGDLGVMDKSHVYIRAEIAGKKMRADMNSPADMVAFYENCPTAERFSHLYDAALEKLAPGDNKIK